MLWAVNGAGHRKCEPDNNKVGMTAGIDECSDSNHRVAILICDGCSMTHIVDMLTKACALFTENGQFAEDGCRLNIQILSSRTGFVSCGDWSIPVWAEALESATPSEFEMIVIAQRPAFEKTAELSSVHDWLAQAGPDVKIIELAPDAKKFLAGHPALTEGARPVHHKTPQLSERIEASIQWLNEHYAERISISAIAQRASMSERNFLRRFKAEVGQTPSQYLSSIRLESARQLLLHTNLPVDKIARHCGFFNGDHLRKQFLKYFGISPAKYRATKSERPDLL
ncbi:helix-turn-helix protein [Trinickia symbiotica]|nr:helix-turn-helix domain-containing protein [Trinickia symbiotica]PPK43008.1 helix-turn-helix protein [Trinickia symbiotica]